jgi:general secretion pathway protein D
MLLSLRPIIRWTLLSSLVCPAVLAQTELPNATRQPSVARQPNAKRSQKPGLNGGTQPAKPDSKSSTTAPPAPNGDQGFTSKKTDKSFAQSHIEEITNENFPDLIESFDYPNADIADLVKAISELTGKNFIVDPNVHGKITIIAPSRITVAEAYKAFLSALAINGLAVVPGGDGFYKIKQARAAQRDNIETYGGAYYPSSDQMITRIVKLKYISADEINKQLRIITSNQGEVMAYIPTNSLIISDYGANIDRVMKILAQLDVQGFEEQMEAIRIRYAKAKDMSDLIDQIINKGEKSSGGGFPGGVPRFRRPGAEGGSSSGAEVYSVVVPDERTNSIIVVGNKAGIEKIRHLVARLDFRLRPDEQGGVFVYYVRNHEAEAIANTLNNIASEAKKALDQTTQGKTGGAPSGPGGQIGPPSTAIFGGDVKIAADKITNSLIITASKQDYEIVKNILSKIDIARDQVFIKAYILELTVSDENQWAIDYYKFAGVGAARIGFRGSDSLQGLLDPTGDKGGIFGFGAGGTVNITPPGSTTTGGTAATIPVTSIAGMIKFIATHSNTNIISTPQIMAINNEEAMIEVGDKVPVARNEAVTGTTVASNVQRENITTKLTITPYLSPDNDRVKMKVKQEVAGLSQVPIKAAALATNAIATSTRNITTQMVVENGDTAVLGGLMKDEDTETILKIPILGDIPIIGWLFKAKDHLKAKTNLMVFLTPKIVRSSEDSASIVNTKINERIDFIQKNMDGRDVHGSYIDGIPRRAAISQKPTSPGDESPIEQEEPAVETF